MSHGCPAFVWASIISSSSTADAICLWADSRGRARLNACWLPTVNQLHVSLCQSVSNWRTIAEALHSWCAAADTPEGAPRSATVVRPVAWLKISPVLRNDGQETHTHVRRFLGVMTCLHHCRHQAANAVHTRTLLVIDCTLYTTHRPASTGTGVGVRLASQRRPAVN